MRGEVFYGALRRCIEELLFPREREWYIMDSTKVANFVSVSQKRFLLLIKTDLVSSVDIASVCKIGNAFIHCCRVQELKALHLVMLRC